MVTMMVRLITLLMIVGLMSCAKKKESAPEEVAAPVVSLTSMENIMANLLPISMRIDTGERSSTSFRQLQQARLPDECDDYIAEGISAIIKCQLQYAIITFNDIHDVLTTVNGLEKSLTSSVSGLSDGLFDGLSDDNRLYTAINVHSSNYTEFLYRTDYVTPSTFASYMYLSSQFDTTYDFRIDVSQSELPEARLPIKTRVSVTYDAIDDWTVIVNQISTEPDSEDLREASRLRAEIRRESNGWSGKMFIYAPYWAAPEGTDFSDLDNESDSTGTAIYVSFEADNNVAKFNLYLLPRTVANVADITSSNYQPSELLTHFPNAFGCNNYRGQDICATTLATAIAGMQNPICITGGSTTPNWNSTGNTADYDSCMLNSSAVSAGLNHTAIPWIAPTVFRADTITLPTTIF